MEFERKMSEQEIIFEEKKDIFRDIEKKGEEFKEQFEVLFEHAKKSMNIIVEGAKFEATYALSVDKKTREKTMKDVKEVREELWEEALKKANGDVNEAHNVYEKTCVFP